MSLMYTHHMYRAEQAKPADDFCVWQMALDILPIHDSWIHGPRTVHEFANLISISSGLEFVNNQLGSVLQLCVGTYACLPCMLPELQAALHHQCKRAA